VKKPRITQRRQGAKKNCFVFLAVLAAWREIVLVALDLSQQLLRERLWHNTESHGHGAGGVSHLGDESASQGFPDGTNARRMQAGLRFTF